jgi:hypothetical protein
MVFEYPCPDAIVPELKFITLSSASAREVQAKADTQCLDELFHRFERTSYPIGPELAIDLTSRHSSRCNPALLSCHSSWVRFGPKKRRNDK